MADKADRLTIKRRAALKSFGIGLMASAVDAPLRAQEAGSPFQHGVASGDPLADRVILWTRVTPPPGQSGPVLVNWQISPLNRQEEVAASGTQEAVAAKDFTVKVDATGLVPGQRYQYSFKTGDFTSPTGRTRTLPVGDVERMTLGICSCSNYPYGFFNVYKEIAENTDIDVVLHLGDYIYEYAAGKYSAPDIEAAGRTADPANEIVSVSDYRQRYALYRTDPDLQAVHAVHPFITIWDDHEFSNDTWSGGAENHQPEQEGLFTQRRENALKVYAEWMPTRADMRRPWRSFDFGNLARIIMLDTRIWGRDKQLDYAADFQPRTIPFDVTDPKNPKPLATPNARASYAAEDIKRLPVPFDFRQDPPKPVMDYTTLSTFDPKTAPQYLAYLPDVGAFKEQLESPGRSLLGEEQEAWLGPQLQGSKKRGQPWQIIGQQVVMGNIVIPPDLADVVEGQTGEVADAIRSVARLAPYKLPTNLDAWDGYPAARARLYAQLRQYARNGIVISGDSHNAWLNELADDKGKVGYEFAVPSVSSPGYEGYIGTSAKQLESSLAAASPGLQWMDARHRGYVTLHVTQDQVEATYHRISTAKSRDYEQLPKKRFTVRAGESPADAALSDLG